MVEMWARVTCRNGRNDKRRLSWAGRAWALGRCAVFERGVVCQIYRKIQHALIRRIVLLHIQSVVLNSIYTVLRGIDWINL